MFYIDNVLVLYYKNYKRDALALITRLNIAYKMYLLKEIKQFLRIQVIRDKSERKIWLTHDTYIKKITKKFQLDNQKCLSILLPRVEFVKQEEALAKPAYIKAYQEKVGSVLYIAIII